MIIPDQHLNANPLWWEWDAGIASIPQWQEWFFRLLCVSAVLLDSSGSLHATILRAKSERPVCRERQAGIASPGRASTLGKKLAKVERHRGQRTFLEFLGKCLGESKDHGRLRSRLDRKAQCLSPF